MLENSRITHFSNQLISLNLTVSRVYKLKICLKLKFSCKKSLSQAKCFILWSLRHLNMKYQTRKAMVAKANNVQATFNPVYVMLENTIAPKCKNHQAWVNRMDRLKRLTRDLNFTAKRPALQDLEN